MGARYKLAQKTLERLGAREITLKDCFNCKVDHYLDCYYRFTIRGKMYCIKKIAQRDWRLRNNYIKN